ncbi:MAG: hypothetical protein JO222_11515, partial [Frankiales bacterium]|nr:hypothetical protein [Frankiales bacterium]
MTDVVGRRPSRRISVGLALATALGGVVGLTHVGAAAQTHIVRSVVKGTDGKSYWVTNHLVTSVPTAHDVVTGRNPGHHAYLLVWAGDANVADTKGSDIQGTHIAVNPVKTTNEDAV